MTAFATRYGRYGYRRITGLLRWCGWKVNHKRIERLWRREGLKVPKKQPKRGRLWLNDGSCIRRRPEHRNHVWAYDFVADRTHDGRALKMLTVVDEFTRECLAIHVARHMKSIDVLQVIADLIVERGAPEYIRSDNGPEFAAILIRRWLARVDVDTLKEAQVLIERWRVEYNTIRPHSSLGYRPPTPAAILPFPPSCAPLRPSETGYALT